MADVKISALTVASALDGSELLPVVQGGSTRAATVDQISDFLGGGSFTAESDAAISAGQIVYIKGTSHVGLASCAVTVAEASAVGIALASVGIGDAATIRSEGKVTMPDWSAVAGSANLSVGSVYFLSPTAGMITTAAPTSVGQFVMCIGRAVSTSTLDLQISQIIAL